MDHDEYIPKHIIDIQDNLLDAYLAIAKAERIAKEHNLSFNFSPIKYLIFTFNGEKGAWS